MTADSTTGPSVLDRRITQALEGRSPSGGAWVFAGSDSAVAKAESALLVVNKYTLDLSKIAFLRVGGADGTELQHLLTKTHAPCGVLLEFDDGLCGAARGKVQVLKQAGKQMEVFTGDARQKLGPALDLVRSWREQGRIQSLVVTIHAVLHEFPDRGEQTSALEDFLQRFVAQDMPVLLIVREPCAPRDLPETVYLSAKCNLRLLESLAKRIKDSHPEFVNMPQPKALATSVRMHSRLAAETIVKMFYLESFQYEIQERVTSFSRDGLLDAFRRVFGTDNVRHEDLQSDSFDRLWDQHGLCLQDKALRELAKPQLHIRIIARWFPGRTSGEDPGQETATQGTPTEASGPVSGKVAPIWNVPHTRNVNFTGREDLLRDLRTKLVSGELAALTQAISGLGGVGKTQLAVEYAYRHSQDYSFVWWVRAETLETLAADYAALASRLGLPERDLADQRAIVAAVRRWLETHGGWLLVFDNVPDPENVRDYLPTAGSGHVIVTSRYPNWRGVAGVLPVTKFNRQESVDFLLRRTGWTDRTGADQVAEALGDLPLALEQAGSYMEAARRSFPQYLELFRTHRSELLRRGAPSTEYPYTVATTWDISFHSVQEESPGAADLMRLCAFLAPDAIPRRVLTQGAQHLPRALAAALAEPVAYDDAVAALRRYSLIEADSEALSVHRLVQAVVYDWLPQDARTTWAEAAVRLLDGAFPFDSDDVRTWGECSLLLPHALAAAGHGERLKVAPEATGRLLNQAGLYLKGRAQFAEAKQAFERALAIDEAAYGPNHPTVARDVNNLGLVLRELGDLAGAREHIQRALAIDEAAYGPNHPTVAIDVNNLGLVLRELGDLAGARAHFERALAIDEAAYGPNHPTVAIDVNNLGGMLQDMGDLAGARAHFERALAIAEAAYGPVHPTVAIRVNNLGGVLQDMGDLAGARAHFERALAIDEAAYGPVHPTVAIRVNNLGMVLRELGDLAGARAHFQRALAIDEAAYGPVHPTVAVDVNNLGMVLRELGDLAGARAHFQRAATIRQRSSATGPNAGGAAPSPS